MKILSQELLSNSISPFQALIEAVKDLLPDWLDAQFGSTVTDNDIFIDLPRYYENEFHEDMAALNVRRGIKWILGIIWKPLMSC